ncbi:MAG: exonuclease domain-containing protein [Anaerolineae bacterium]
MLNLSISEVPLVFVDTETTGLNPLYGDRIVEIALARFRGGVMENYYETLVNPQRPIGAAAARIHGISDREVSGAPAFAEITSRLYEEFADAVVVGHNAPFDLGFIANEFKLARQPYPDNLVLDTLTFLRQYFRFPSNGLQRVAEYLGIHPGRAHRAMADVLTTQKVFAYIVKNLQLRGALTLQDFLEWQGGTIPWQAPAASEIPVPPLVETALQRNLRLFLRYRDEKGTLSERWVSPIGVRAEGRIVYLRAFCHLRNGERYFRLDRIVEMGIEQ